jgi:beta-xylosidase
MMNRFPWSSPGRLFWLAMALCLIAGRTFAANDVFLFSYFMGNGEDGLHLARSEDGLNWTAVGGGRSFLTPVVGENKLMRDPCLLLGPDGMFRMVWTTSWAGQTIGYASSADLRHWSDQVALSVMAKEPTTVNCWAPEVIYDSDRKDYLIYWASTIPGRFVDADERATPAGKLVRNHRIYCTTTTDFQTYTPTRLYYEPGFNAIDATVDADGGGGWLMFVKDETEQPQPAKSIHLVRMKTAEGPFSPPSPPIHGPYWAEGPTAIKIGGNWYVYFDRYREHRFGVVRSADLIHWDDLSDQLHLPAGIRHGTVLRVPRAIADALH